jgi:hypothetical protein
MAFSELEQKPYEEIMDAYIESRRPPVEIRDKLDIGYRIDGQAIEIFEIRPRWNQPGVKLERPVAKARYFKSSGEWHVYWMRADLKWHSYEPESVVETLEQFLKVVNEDRYACFWG